MAGEGRNWKSWKVQADSWMAACAAAEEAKDRLDAENAQLRQLAEDRRVAARAYEDELGKAIEEAKRLRQQLEEAPSRQVFEAHVRMLAETRARLQTVEGERDAALFEAANWKASSYRENDKLEAAQRENGALRDRIDKLRDAMEAYPLTPPTSAREGKFGCCGYPIDGRQHAPMCNRTGGR